MKAIIRIIAGFAMATVICQGTFSAQMQNPVQDSAGKVNGIVKDTHDAAVQGVSIVFESRVSGKKFKRKVESDSNGWYEIDLPVGLYRLTVKFSGFRKFQHKELMVEVGKSTRFDIVLKENPRRYTTVTRQNVRINLICEAAARRTKPCS
ncbi:MAG: carboxypeptidase-like regulatory domain-containing protein [Pyrinomonadaceae bacterium]